MRTPFIVAILAALAGWLAVHWLARKGRAEYRDEGERLATLMRLSIQDAAAAAARVLVDKRIARSIEAPVGDEALLQPLAPEIHGLLARYELIEFPRIGASVERRLLGQSARRPGFIRIGHVGAGTDVEGEVAVLPSEEGVYELHANETPDPEFGTYKSIHHWLLAMAQEARR